jgi:hypothetical protein
MRHVVSSFLAVGAAALAACGPSSPQQGPESTSDLSAIVAVPATGVQCITLTVTGATHSVERSFDVTPGQSTAVLTLRRVPTGNALLSGDAYDASCRLVAATSDPSWSAEAVAVTIAAGGVPAAATLTFRPNGKVVVGADFVDDVFVTSTIAGQPGVQGALDGVGAGAQLEGPNALALQGDTLFFTDRAIDNNSGDIAGMTVRALTLSTGQVTTIAGSATELGNGDGDGLAARFSLTRSIALYGGDLLIADRCAIRRLTTAPPYTVTTLFGTPVGTIGFRCLPLAGAVLDIAVHGTDVYILDTTLAAVFKASLLTTPLSPSLVAGTPGSAGFVDGTLGTALFNSPTGLVFPSPASDDFYLSDQFTSPDGSTSWSAIRQVSPSAGTVTTVAGAPQAAGQSQDGVGPGALFNSARRLVSDGHSLFTGDLFAIRRIDLSNFAVITIAGGNAAGTADGVGTAAQFNAPFGLALGPGGTIYVADQGNFTLRRLTP